MSKFENKIVNGNSLEALRKIPDKTFNIIFADPPYNLQIGEKLKVKPKVAYIDGPFAPKNIKKMKNRNFIKGDEKITCIAAASIIAKATRDLFMIKLAKKYPKYSWNKNFGYGTADHLLGLKKYGITKHHRKKFKPIYKILMSKTRETQ